MAMHTQLGVYVCVSNFTGTYTEYAANCIINFLSTLSLTIKDSFNSSKSNCWHCLVL